MGRFLKATRKQLKLRLALCGPTGSGKTKLALLIAAYLGKRIAVIDTENRSASKFIGDPGVPEFEVEEKTSFEPSGYVESIKEAEREFDVLIVDSATHAWSGKGGALEQVDRAAKRSQSGNSFTAWRDVTPQHNALVDAMVQCRAHLITTMRSKMEHVLEEDSRGKKTPRKVGMAPIQRDGMEYEFDVVMEIDTDHNVTVTKTRCSALDGRTWHKPNGREIAEILLQWLGEGVVDNQPRPGEDEFGLKKPLGPCPTVTNTESANYGKPWTELNWHLVEKMLAERGAGMSPNAREWCQYIVAYNKARKAKQEADARAAELAAEQDAAEQAFAAQEAAERGEEPAAAEGGGGADPNDEENAA